MQSLPGLGIMSDIDMMESCVQGNISPKQPLLIYPGGGSDSKNIIYQDYRQRFKNNHGDK
jgi:hypothetical protein